MVWIETALANEIINEEMIQSIYLELPDPEDISTNFKFYARINNKEWEIYSVYIPEGINELPNDSDIRASYFMALAEELFKKLMFFIFEAKKKNNNQVLSLREKFHESGFLEKYQSPI